jgi:hypothetical protein
MNTYLEFLEKAQSEFLGSLQKAQELNIATFASVKDLMSSVPATTETNGTITVPSPVELVERSFAFTNQLLETRKAYMLKLAEMATKTSSN